MNLFNITIIIGFAVAVQIFSLINEGKSYIKFINAEVYEDFKNIKHKNFINRIKSVLEFLVITFCPILNFLIFLGLLDSKIAKEVLNKALIIIVKDCEYYYEDKNIIITKVLKKYNKTIID